MVSVTIYIEGGTVNANESAEAQTIDNSSVFREGFHKLFSQKFAEDDFDLIVQPIGPISQTKNYLKRLIDDEIDGVILIDLDGPKNQKNDRLQSYSPLDTSRLFFMIQEMESWILSQPEKLDEHAENEGLTRKRRNEEIENDPLIRNTHPEELSDPSGKLNTLFRKYFSIEKNRRGKVKKGPKSYSKTKDGPKLIGLLNLDSLIEVFDEANNLIIFLMDKNQGNVDADTAHNRVGRGEP
ncbi:MAG: hypothetical protein KIPDCIKN_04186 [Haliscomenobacter sp.]|nr:hypothetical protein [Haliscomenobacter sp.]